MFQWWRNALRQRRGTSGPGFGNPARINRRGLVQFQKYERTANVAFLEDALSAFRDAVSATSLDHPGRPGFLSNLGLALGIRSEWRQDPADADEAIAYLQEAVSAMPADHPDWPGVVSNLGKMLRGRYRLTMHPVDLDEAVSVGQRSVSAVPVGHPDRPMFLANLAETLKERYERAGRPADLDGAIDAARAAVDDGPARHPEGPLHSATLAVALRTRFELTGNQADLDEAIVLAHEALVATPAGHPNRPPVLFDLAVALRLRFERAGDLEDLDEAIVLMSDAVAASPAEHPNRLVGLSNLAGLLSDRYEHTGDPADLEEAIEIRREALVAVPTNDPSRPYDVGALGNVLRIRYEHNGDATDLDEAVALCREAVAASPTDHPALLSNLAAALQDRYGRTGQASDLNEAIARIAAAVMATPSGHVDRPVYLSNLGAVRADLYRRTEEPTDLDDAIAALAEAVATTAADDPWRPVRLSNFAATVMARYEQTERPADLDEAVARFEEALTTTPPEHPNRPLILSNLAALLLARHLLTGQPADLDEAITGFTEAVATTPTDHPHRTVYLRHLADALRERYEQTEDSTDLERAVAALREGAAAATAPPAQRLAAARLWGEALIQADDPRSAVQAYTAAIELLAVVVWHGLDQSTREGHLREWAGLSADAAAAAVAAGALPTAVELVEAGRSILWAQARQLRQDLAALRARAPELAAELETARTTLADPDPPGAEGVKLPDPDQALALEHEMLEQRRQAARAWDAAVDEVRRLTGFEHFLRPVPVTDLLTTATARPVVIVNISTHGGSQALILMSTAPDSPGGNVRVVDLPDAPMDTVLEKTANLLEAQERPDRQLLFDVLAWEWQAITEPVLHALGCTSTPGDELESWPRVWWCPTGPAVLLPLHAAGLHPRSAAEYAAVGERAAAADTVAGRVVSSYTPTLAALARARTQPPPVRVRQLAVGVAEPPLYARRANPLPAVSAELRRVSDFLPAPEYATHLLDRAATRRAVLDALPGYSWLHMACHGVQDQNDANLSAFLLHDQPLTLADLTTVTLPEADLAYLSACQTATGDFDLTDEHLHLAAGLQLIGYRHVLATLWSISDSAAPAMAQAVYEHLTQSDVARQPDANRAPHALHHAVARLRRSAPADPLIWAPFIHLGP